MSFGMMIQTPNDIVMGADTAVTVTLNKELYRLHEEGVKLFIIGDMLIYCSGVMRVAKKCMEELDESKEKTVNKLKDILLFNFNQYLAQNKEAKERYEKEEDCIISAMVAQNKNGKPHFYSLEPKDGFAIKENSPPDKGGMYIATDGIKTDESYNFVTKLVSEQMRLSGRVNTEEVFQSSFDHMSYEGIGGILTLVHLNKDGIRVYYQNPIKEKLNLKRVTLTGIKAAAINAGTMTSVESTIGTGNNIFKATTSGIQLGHTLFSSAPFRVDMFGNLVATQADIKGAINCDSLKIAGVNVLANGGTKISGQYIDSITTGQITVTTKLGDNALDSAGKWNGRTTYLNENGIYAGTISANQINAGTINGNIINGGTISGVNINVASDINLGNWLRLKNVNNDSQGIISDGQGNITFTTDGRIVLGARTSINIDSATRFSQVPTVNSDLIATQAWVQQQKFPATFG